MSGQIHTRKGKKIIREVIAALDKLPKPRLISGRMEFGGDFCAIGALYKDCSLNTSFDPSIHQLAAMLDAPVDLIDRIMAANDHLGSEETPEQRWERMRNFLESWLPNEKE